MSVVTARHDLSKQGSYTMDDYDALPEGDGVRYELHDGTLLVSASPAPVHQSVVAQLYDTLRDACAPDQLVLFAPVDYRPTSTRAYVPDLLLIRDSTLGPRYVVEPPILVAEVLSPSNRSIDLGLKRDAYAEAGVEHYWIVDPLRPSFTALRLRDGVYKEAGIAVDDQRIRLLSPCPVLICPERLIEPPRGRSQH